MPPKKAAAVPTATNPNHSDEPSMISIDGGEGSSKGSKKKHSDIGLGGEPTLGIEEYMMPRMMTVRLAKGVLPPQTLIHKDAATAMQFATSVFLNHVASAANEHTLNASRKNISPQDILSGIRDTEWGFLAPQLEEELSIYVRTVNDKRNEYRRRLKERDSGVGVGGPGGGAGGGGSEGGKSGMDGGEDGGEDGPRAKRARLSEGATLDESQMEEELRDEEMQEEGEQEDEEGEDDEVEDEGEDDDDDDGTEAYGSAAEDLPVDGADDDMDDRDTGGSEDESD